MADLTLVEAVNLALAHEMARDPDVLLLGEDIGVNGGVFRATNGLHARHGRARVLDTPLAEISDRRGRDRHGRDGIEAGRRNSILRFHLSGH